MVQALVVALVIVVLDESLELSLGVCKQETIFQQDSIFQGLVPSLDLALFAFGSECHARGSSSGPRCIRLCLFDKMESLSLRNVIQDTRTPRKASSL